MSIIYTHEQLREAMTHYEGKDFAYDVETVGEQRGHPMLNRVTWLAMATDGRTDVIPFGHPNGEFVEWVYPRLPSGNLSKDKRKATSVWTQPPAHLHFDAEVREILVPIFTQDVVKVGHNIKFDLLSIYKHLKVLPTPRYFCTMVAAFLLDNRVTGKNGLADNAERELGFSMVKGVGKEVEAHSFRDVAKYSHIDVKYSWLLYKELLPRLETDGLSNLFRLEMDVLEVLCRMFLAGAPINVAALKHLDASLQEQLVDTEAEVYRAAGKAFALGSTPEKVKILYGPKADGGQGLRPRKETPSGNPSVDQKALEAYAGKNAVVDALLAHSELAKLRSTYTLPYLGGTTTRTTAGKTKEVQVQSMLVDGRIHTDFVQTGAETGRFSSRNPNLQNVPNPGSPNGKLVRSLFHAGDGYKLVVADYSQIEPRVLADFSGDPTLIKAYLSGEDIYEVIATPLGLPRKGGKVMVLAMSYGIGDDKIAADLDCSKAKVKEIRADFAKVFPSLKKYQDDVIRESKHRKPVYASTILGRRRYLPDLYARETWQKSRAERQAFNTKIQGSAADIIKLAMVRAHRMLPPEARLTLTIHDEIVTRCPAGMADDIASVVREAMEGITLLKKVPLIADIKVVDSWDEAK